MDDRETVELELDEATFCTLAHLAHDQDITFNKLVENILREAMDNEKQLPS
jgi:predicted DNA-binding ribbon-helix-helix protein